MKRLAGVTGIALMLAIAPSAGQRGGRGGPPIMPPQAPPQNPVFRTRTEAILLDLRVVDRDGHFVPELTKDDFRVLEDDRRQTVTTFSLTSIPVATEIAAVADAPADVASNAGTNHGRVYVMVLDDLEIEADDNPAIEEAVRLLGQAARSKQVRELARNFVEHHVEPNDQVALMTTSGRPDMRIQFTSDRRRLIAAIERFQGGYGQITYTSNPIPGAPPVRNNVHLVMLTLKSVAEWMNSVSGRRKGMVLFGERLGRTMNAGNLDLATAENIDIQQFVDAAARSNVSLYAVDTVGVMTGKAGTIKPAVTDDNASYDLDRLSSLTVVAQATGGFAATNSNDYAPSFKRIVEENSSYYLLGYTSTNTKQDGKFRRIRVEVTRPGLKVVARSGYTVAKPAPPPNPSRVDAGAMRADLAELVKSPISVTGLPLSVAAAPFRRDGAASLAVIVEARPSESQMTRATQKLEVAVVAADQDGKVKKSERGSMSLTLSARTREIVAAQGVRLLSSIELQPGNYHLIVAATDPDGSLNGSVQFDVKVPDFSKPLTMSGVVLGSVRTAMIPSGGTSARWTTSLGMTPTTVRAFDPSDELRSMVEVYDNDVRREHATRVTTTVRSASGEAVFSQAQTLPRIAGLTSHQVVVPIPLAELPPGQYVLSVDAVSSARPDDAVVNRVPFTVRPPR